MSRNVLAQSVAILLEDEQAESRVRVDLVVSLRVCDVDITGTEPKFVPDTDEELLEVGGVWDRREKRWLDDRSETLLVIRIPRGSEQEPAARWLAEWMRRAGQGSRGPHWDDFERVWTLLLEGGRRGGKSYLAVVALVMFMVMVAHGLVWAISPTQDETDELEQALRSIIPTDWYTARGGGGGGAGRALQLKLANGSRLLCLSGHKSRTLKRGRVDLALYNEGQNMSRAGWIQLRGAVADRGGLVIVAANPPDAEIGRWIENLHERARAKKIRAAIFKLTARTNPFVEVRALDDMADEVDALTFRREVLGEFVPIGDVVMHAWSDTESVLERIPDGWIDATAEFTRKQLGRGAGYTVGMDFQRTPHMPGIVFKFFRDPSAPPDDDIIPIVCDEAVVEDADENDLVDALEAIEPWNPDGSRIAGDGYRGWIDTEDVKDAPSHCSVVMDASGWFQDGAHTKGRTSDRALAARRWTFLYKPQKDSDRNPDIIERVKTTNARLKTASGRRRMFVMAHCERVIRAMRSWENRGLAPSRTSDYAHIGDAVSYVVYRFFGRPKVKGGGLKYISTGRRTRAAEIESGGQGSMLSRMRMTKGPGGRDE